MFNESQTYLKLFLQKYPKIIENISKIIKFLNLGLVVLFSRIEGDPKIEVGQAWKDLVCIWGVEFKIRMLSSKFLNSTFIVQSSIRNSLEFRNQLLSILCNCLQMVVSPLFQFRFMHCFKFWILAFSSFKITCNLPKKGSQEVAQN